MPPRRSVMPQSLKMNPAANDEKITAEFERVSAGAKQQILMMNR
jgi:hypothetical protein